MQRRKQIRGPEDSLLSEPEGAAPAGVRSEERARREGGRWGGGWGPGGERETPGAQPPGGSVTWASTSPRVPEQPVPTPHTCSGETADTSVTITVARAFS